MSEVRSLRTERLRRVATKSGHIAILAIDHVRSFATVARPNDPGSMEATEIIEAKIRLADRLLAHVGAVLIDPAFAEASPSMVSDLSKSAGVVLGIEDGDYADVRTSPRLLPGWNIERSAALGVDAVKISVFFDADGDNTQACRFVEDVGEQCQRFDMPVFCEPLALIPDDALDRRRHILEGVRLFGCLGVDVLKIQFPERVEAGEQAWADACDEVDATSPTPWTLLSEGKDFDVFSEVLEVACRAGASGFLGGRSIWADALFEDDALSISAERLDRLCDAVRRTGTRWDNHPAPTGNGGSA